MSKVKKTPINKFEEYIKKSIFNIEHIRTKQEEKQAVLDEYEKQHGRFADGRISKRAYNVSVKKNKALLSSIDSQIRSSINVTKKSLQSALKVTSKQVPIQFNVSLEGLTSPAKRVFTNIKRKVSRKPAKRAPVKRKAVKKKVVRRRR
ncbi:MAG: hypothetical protein GON13_01515 [Nanoarchaeota archaeon]|nr:hypothetical protein [Nanoarchaeota archaeon]